MKRPVVALALGSGSAKGLAHIGVLKVLIKNKIPIDIITGTSIGSVIGAFYAFKKDISMVENLALHTDNRQIIKLLDPSFSSGLIKGNKIEKFLEEHLGNINFEDLKIPLVVVATDVNSGNPVYFDKGNLINAIRASISIPLLFNPVIRNNDILIDGHFCEPVPVTAALNKGADVVIAVNLDSKPIIKDKSKLSFRDIASISSDLLLYQLAKANTDKANVVISPVLGNLKSFNFSDGDNSIKKGESATLAVLPEIKKAIKNFKK